MEQGGHPPGDGEVGRGLGRVNVQLRDGLVELRFSGRFTAADLARVKAIEGRRWEAARRVWTLPRVPDVLSALQEAFGSRLVVVEEDPARKPPRNPEPARAIGDDVEAVLRTLRRVLRTRGYSPKTEKAYVGWVRRFLLYHSPLSVAEGIEVLNRSHAEAFLEHLATGERLAPRSRNQAASALGFMFREVLGRDEMADVPRAKGPKRLPMVLSHREVLRVLGALTRKYFAIAVLLYSAGLRLEECLRIRVKDIDFELRQILVRNAKGRKDRYVPLARRAIGILRAQLRQVAERHRRDRAEGHGWAPLPGALHRKKPSAGYELRWQFLFPASTIHADPATGRTGRRHLHPSAVQREVSKAVRTSGISKPASCHTFRHSFATEALRGGCDIRTLQHVLGHRDIRTTMIYLHVIEQTGHYVRSPLDRPDDPVDPSNEPMERPWSSEDIEWDLAAKQWGRSQRSS